ncbi:MAG: phosphatase RsbU N-terminal domain-containing protein [Pedococcus sp.]
MSEVENLTLDYRAAFQRYLPQRSEAALTLGYQLGRRAIAHDVSLLDLVDVHHLVLTEILEDTADEDARDVTTAAAEFLREVLSTFDMAHRSLPSAPQNAAQRPGGG